MECITSTPNPYGYIGHADLNFRRFRWVVCQLDALRSCMKLADLRKAWNCLPKTLDETYNRILVNIDKEYFHEAYAALQWMTFSMRPLRLEELAEAAVVRPECRSLGAEDRLRDHHDILMICSSLVTLSEGNELRLAHYSVQEYLLSDRIAMGPASAFHLVQGIVDDNIAEICITPLLMFDQHGSMPERNLQDFPLLQYAAEFWYEHARRASKVPSQRNLVTLSVRLLDEKNPSFLNWLRTCDPDNTKYAPNYNKELISFAQPIYYESCCGLMGAAKMLLEKGAEVNGLGGVYGTPLQAAAVNGYKDIAKLLLDYGAEVNLQG